MGQQNIIGYYGKLPTHGDFVNYNLPRCFTEVWDQWLQECLVYWRKTFQGDWMVNYLTMPAHRFILSPGIAGETHWYGVLLPSRDRAGRLFPFTVCIPLPADGTDPIKLHGSNQAWLDQLEATAISCLMPDFTKEQLTGKFQDTLQALSTQLPPNVLNACTSAKNDPLPIQTQFAWHSRSKNPATQWKKLLDVICKEYMHAYSIWWIKDDNDLMFCQGLPAVEQTPALIDQQWGRWGWLTATETSKPEMLLPPDVKDDDTQTL